MYLYIAIVTLFIFIIVYLLNFRNEKFTLHYRENSTVSKKLFKQNEALFRSSTTALFFFSGKIQTLFIAGIDAILHLLNQVGINPYHFNYQRKIYVLRDGGQIAIDKAVLKNKANLNNDSRKKLKILIIPGFTSFSEDFYLKDLVSGLVNDYDVSVVTGRGFGGVKLANHIMVSSDMEYDLAEYITHYCKENRKRNVLIIAFSFGGMMLTKYLTNTNNVMPKNLIGTCSICSPICMRECMRHTEYTLFGIFSRAPCLNLRKCFYDNIDTIFQHPELSKENDEIIRKVKEAKYSSCFAKAYTYKSLGLETVEHYYDNIKINDNDILNIKIPFFAIFSEDDPVIPFYSVPIKTMIQNKNISLLTVSSGGHSAFYSGFIPRRWLIHPIKSYIEITELNTKGVK